MSSSLHTVVKTASAAGLVGLVVLHPEPFARIIARVVGTFRRAVQLT